MTESYGDGCWGHSRGEECDCAIGATRSVINDDLRGRRQGVVKLLLQHGVEKNLDEEELHEFVNYLSFHSNFIKPHISTLAEEREDDKVRAKEIKKALLEKGIDKIDPGMNVEEFSRKIHGMLKTEY